MSSPEFLQLLTSHQSRIYAYILSLVFNPDQADELLQKTNLVLWKKEDKFEPGTNFTAWALRIAYFEVLSYRRSLKREKLVFDDELLHSMAGRAEEEDELFEQRQRLLRQCMEKLNQHQRTLIKQRYTAELSLNHIAEQLNRSVNAIKQGLFRARANLIQCVRTNITADMPQELIADGKEVTS